MKFLRKSAQQKPAERYDHQPAVHSRLLLIDTVESLISDVAEVVGIPVEWASLGHGFKNTDNHDQLFRDLREYPVIIDDALNAYENQMQTRNEETERLYGRGQRGPPLLYSGSRIGSPLSRYAFAWSVKDVYGKVLRAGGLIVTFAGPVHEAPMPPAFAANRDPDLAPIAHYWSAQHWPSALSNYGSSYLSLYGLRCTSRSRQCGMDVGLNRRRHEQGKGHRISLIHIRIPGACPCPKVPLLSSRFRV